MADFWQQGAMTVLQRLRNRPIAELEKEIEAIARRRRIVLLPALYTIPASLSGLFSRIRRGLKMERSSDTGRPETSSAR